MGSGVRPWSYKVMRRLQRHADKHHSTGIEAHLIGAINSKCHMTGRTHDWGLKASTDVPEGYDIRSVLLQASRRSCSQTCPLSVFATIPSLKANPNALFHGSRTRNRH